jgi:hypothetical protein
MFDEDIQPDQMLAEAPSLPTSLLQRARAALERLNRAARFSLFWETPGPDAVYSTGDNGAPPPSQPPCCHDASATSFHAQPRNAARQCSASLLGIETPGHQLLVGLNDAPRAAATLWPGAQD